MIASHFHSFPVNGKHLGSSSASRSEHCPKSGFRNARAYVSARLKTWPGVPGSLDSWIGHPGVARMISKHLRDSDQDRSGKTRSIGRESARCVATARTQPNDYADNGLELLIVVPSPRRLRKTRRRRIRNKRQYPTGAAKWEKIGENGVSAYNSRISGPVTSLKYGQETDVRRNNASAYAAKRRGVPPSSVFDNDGVTVFSRPSLR